MIDDSLTKQHSNLDELCEQLQSKLKSLRSLQDDSAERQKES